MNVPRAAEVLVVDDDRGVRAVIRAALSVEGFSVIEAASGEEALRIVATRPVDAVLLDQRLEQAPGLEVLTRLRSDPTTATLPVLVLTGDADTNVAVALEAGANDYLAKPFDTAELVARVRAQLRHHARWLRLFEDQLLTRARTARMLAGLSGLPSLEAVADGACELIWRAPGILGAAVVGFTERQTLVLGRAGQTLRLGPPGSRVREDTATQLRAAATHGPSAALVPPSAGLGRPAVAAVAPLHARDRLLGVLVLYCDPPSGMARSQATQTSMAIDLASVLSALLAPHVRAGTSRERNQLLAIIDHAAFAPNFQPVIDLHDAAVVGYEALTRFADGAAPAARFALAARVGVGLDLEIATARAALAAADRLPSGRWVSINASPGLVVSGALTDLVIPTSRDIIVELTEQERIDDYAAVLAALDGAPGISGLSVDDAGSGFASLQHVLALRPRFIKLDRSWVHGVDIDPARHALIAGLVHFAAETGAQVIAEGVESAGERDHLLGLGVTFAQGYLFARPAPAPLMAGAASAG